MLTSSMARNPQARSLRAAVALLLSFAPAACSENKDQPIADASASPADAPSDASELPGDAPADASVVWMLAAGATQPAVMAAVPGFAAQSGFTVNLTFGSAGALRDQILAGTSGADLAIVTPAVVTALEPKSLVHAGSRVDLAQVPGGVAVRSGDPLPDISDSDKLKAALLAADEIYYADPVLATAGAAFMKNCTTLGIADTCAAAPTGKGHTASGGAEAMAAMALSTATTVIGATQVSEIKSTAGVKLVGEYTAAPVNLTTNTIYTAIIIEGTPHLANAQTLVQFLSGNAFMTELAKYGFVPVPAP